MAKNDIHRRELERIAKELKIPMSSVLEHNWVPDERSDGMPEKFCRGCGEHVPDGVAGMGSGLGPLRGGINKGYDGKVIPMYCFERTRRLWQPDYNPFG